MYDIVGSIPILCFRHYCIFLVFIFANFNLAEKDPSSFSIEITYVGLPSSVICYYRFDKSQMLYKTYIPGMRTFDSIVYRLKESDKIRDFILLTDWTLIPKLIDHRQIDGFFYKLKIVKSQDTFNFEVRNANVPQFDTLFRRCYLNLPNKKAKRNFVLWRE